MQQPPRWVQGSCPKLPPSLDPSTWVGGKQWYHQHLQVRKFFFFFFSCHILLIIYYIQYIQYIQYMQVRKLDTQVILLLHYRNTVLHAKIAQCTPYVDDSSSKRQWWCRDVVNSHASTQCANHKKEVNEVYTAPSTSIQYLIPLLLIYVLHYRFELFTVDYNILLEEVPILNSCWYSLALEGPVRIACLQCKYASQPLSAETTIQSPVALWDALFRWSTSHKISCFQHNPDSY